LYHDFVCWIGLLSICCTWLFCKFSHPNFLN
jgi:hypothetical protein